MDDFSIVSGTSAAKDARFGRVPSSQLTTILENIPISQFSRKEHLQGTNLWWIRPRYSFRYRERIVI